MNRIHITLDVAIAAMLAIVADLGYDKKAGEGNTGCVYGKVSENDFITPVCIVGEYIARLGLLRALVVDTGSNSWEGACGVESTMWDALEKYGVTADKDAKAFLYSVQARQDRPMPWGQAVTGAIEELQVSQQDDVREAERRLAEVREREAFLLNQTAALDALRAPAPLAAWERELLGEYED